MSTEADHISENILKEIVKKRFDGDIKILSRETSPVVPVGENFLSNLVRIEIRFSINGGKDVHSFSVIAKSSIEDDFVSEVAKESDMYMRELSVYKDVLPLVAKQDHTVKVAPELFYFSADSKITLVVEDLARSNYKMANKLEGLNLDHCLLAVEKLAYFHASSIKVYEHNPAVMTMYHNELFKKSKFLDTVYCAFLQSARDASQNEPTLQKYANKIEVNLREVLYEATKPDPIFNVLNHGDFWCNNILFHYDEDNRVNDVIFVDYQMMLYTTPCYDLHYFLCTSTTSEVKKNGFHDILDRYYESLSKNMETLNVKTHIPSRDQFDKMISEKACMGPSFICCYLPFLKAPSSENASLTEFMKSGEEGSFRRLCFNNSNYINAVQYLLPHYESLGAFDQLNHFHVTESPE